MGLYDYTVRNATGDLVSMSEFLVDRAGNVTDRFGSTTTPEKIEAKVVKLL
ncbi:MAG: hypothetical protein IJC51_03670 [Eggerthellaceae bacterium]|nr:hypothetical protein [Eggerthellaceae bacterium]